MEILITFTRFRWSKWKNALEENVVFVIKWVNIKQKIYIALRLLKVKTILWYDSIAKFKYIIHLFKYYTKKNQQTWKLNRGSKRITGGEN